MARGWFAFWCCGFTLLACSESAETAYFSPLSSAGSSPQLRGDTPAGAAGVGSAQAVSVSVDEGGAGGASSQTGESSAGSSGAMGFCTGQAVSVGELASGNVRVGKTVLLSKLVASSQKFLLSASKTSGKCWWGAFAAELGKSGENSGVLLLSSADGVPGEADGGSELYCPPGTDSLPDDLSPGDLLSAFGDFDDYAPSACRSSAPMRELLVKPGCAVVRSGRTAPPAAVTISAELADQLAQGKDKALLRAWSGARIELDDIDALAVASSTSAVGPYGVIRFQQTKLELHSKVPYADLSAGGPQQSGKSLAFDFPVHFERAEGVLYLDYCTWSLELRDRCADLSPQSRGCPTTGG
jgi:hypothetical protein